jgi:type II secretory ATPase GspE/PulE/Tfp pilus assembly ATPase PilB-like protein
MGLTPENAAGFRSLAADGSGLVLFSSWNAREQCRFLDLLLDEGATAGRNVMLLGDGIGRGHKTFPRIPLQGIPGEELESVVAAMADHDPDILVVEDITESRSFLAAWRAAMRRRLVVGGISRGGLSGVFDYLLSERHANRSVMGGVRAIASFAGVGILCPHCRESFPASDQVRGLPPADAYYHSRGCPECGYSRFGGKRYLIDIVTVDTDLRDVFASARDSADILRYLEESGHRGIAGELADLLREGKISPEEYSASIT